MVSGGRAREGPKADGRQPAFKAASSSCTEHLASASLAEVGHACTCLRGGWRTEDPVLDRCGPGHSSGAVAEEGKEH